jgi:hypothetical protein
VILARERFFGQYESNGAKTSSRSTVPALVYVSRGLRTHPMDIF